MLKEILSGFGITLFLTVACFTTATFLGILTCAGFCSKNRLVKTAVKIYNGVIIKIPPLVMLMLFALLLTGNKNHGTVWVAYTGLSLFVAANLAGVFYGGVCSVSKGEIDAARTMGMSKKQTFFHIMLPQILQNTAPVCMSMFIMCTQITSVSSVIGVAEVLGAANMLENPWLTVVISIAAYFIIGTLGDMIITRLGKRRHIYVRRGEKA